METKTYRTIDKSSWPAGVWRVECDKMQFTDTKTRMPCLIIRQKTSGHLCGYVGVTEGHPFFKKDYDDPDVSVHGGLTYAGFCRENADEETMVCHVPGENEPHRVWWFGFDCAHSGDYSPGHAEVFGRNREQWETYRDIGYVKAEVESLARQLTDIAKEGR